MNGGTDEHVSDNEALEPFFFPGEFLIVDDERPFHFD